jgi:hypothetical protein
MDSPMIPLRPKNWVLATLLFFAACCVTNNVLAQSQSPAARGKSALAEDRKSKAAEGGKADGKGDGAKDDAKPAADAAGRAAGPSADYQASIRKTVERRRGRRARRQQNAGDDSGAVGAIVPWPMPPALIVRHTREVHGEVGSLLYGLRK